MRAWWSLLLMMACKSGGDAEDPAPTKKKAPPKEVASASAAPSTSATVVYKTEGRIVASREKQEGLFLLDLEGTATPLRADREGKLTAVWAGPGGKLALATYEEAGKRTMHVARLSGDELMLGDVVLADATGVYVIAASEDGRTVLVDRQSKTESEVMLARAGKPTTSLWKSRSAGGGAVSKDGKRAVFAGVPVTCKPPTWLGNCPYHAFRADLVTLKVEPLSEPKVGAAYQPRFHPTDPETIFFQSTTASAEGCTDFNHCRHDLMVRAFGAETAAPRLLRKNGYGLSFAPSGAFWEFQSLDGSGCSALPCQASALFVGKESEIASVSKPIAEDVAIFNGRFVSPDERFLAYRGTEGGTTGQVGLVIRTVDGKKIRFLEGHHPHGWLR